MKETILKEFDDRKSTISEYNRKMVSLIYDLLNDKSIICHQINGRVKDRESLQKKIDRKQDKYSSLQDITDISGVRVITYLESDVDKVAEIIENEFIIDRENSIDKRKLKADQFGYRSLHYVLECNPKRTNLIEYKQFKNLKFEIQIRSILQHAWAEIEHDLGYKGEVSIPEAHIRGFNRVAALLESADIEFDRLKKELSKYESEVEELIKNQPQNVQIDQTSLLSYNQTNKTLKKARAIIKKNAKCTFDYTTDYSSYISRFKSIFHISSFDQIDKLLSKNEKEFLSFVREFSKNITASLLTESISIYYFQHYLSAINEEPNEVNNYLKESSIASDQGEFINIIKEIRSVANNS